MGTGLDAKRSVGKSVEQMLVTKLSVFFLRPRFTVDVLMGTGLDAKRSVGKSVE